MPMIKAQCENCNGMLQFNAEYGLLVCPFCGATYFLDKNHKIPQKQNVSPAIDEVDDHLFEEAGLYIIRSGKASIGYLQRVLKIGFNRAARIMDELADNGVVGQEQGTKPRDILMTEDMFIAYMCQKEDRYNNYSE